MKMANKLINISSYINGKFLNNKTDFKKIFSPETNEEIANYSSVSFKDLTDAYNDANIAFETWKTLDPNTRITYIEKFNELLNNNLENIANAIVESIAKPRSAAIDEVKRSIQMIKDLIEEYKSNFIQPKIMDEEITHTKNKIGVWTYEPLGVILAIAPFNYPVNLLISKIIPALLTGNVVIYKSAKQTINIGYMIAKLFDEIKIPHGVVNYIVADGKELGNALVSNQNIKLLNFTGGTSTGQELMKFLSYKTNKILEMGGLDPALITKNNDDPNKIAKEIIKGAFSFNGQRCTAIKRIILLKDNHEFNELLKKALINEINNLSIGKAEEDANITALVNNIAVKRVLDLYDDAIKHKAKVLIEPKVQNNLITPILLDEVTKKMQLYNTEAFGPILPIIYAKNIDEMIEIANDTPYGLQASIFTKDKEEWWQIAKKIDAGSINWNKSSSRGPDIFPFLGVKDSGFNVQGIYWSLYTTVRLKGYIENK